MKLILNETQLKLLVDIIKESSSEKKYNVLFVGDSLSAGADYTWNYLLANKHKNDWDVTHDVVGGRRVVGGGGMLQSLEAKLNEKKYDLVFIWGGTNDMFSLVTQSQTKDALQRMANKVIKQGGKPIIFAGYDVASVMTKDKIKPTYYTYTDSITNEKVTKLLCDLKCMKNSREKLISFQDSLENGIPGAYVIPRLTDPRLNAGDGTHIDGVGHQLIADYVNKELPSILQGVKKSNQTSVPNKSWLAILSGAVGGLASQIYDYFFGGSGDNLTKKLISDLENLKNVSGLEFKSGFINYDQDVEPIQVALQLLGFSLDEWGLDGKFGPETQKAVEEFQIKHNLEPNGKVNQEVIKKLIDEIKLKKFTNKDFKSLNVSKTESYDPSESSLKNVQLKGQDFEAFAKELHGTEFVKRVKEIGDNVGLNYKFILATMFFESKMDPKAVNPLSNATGLIQFMPFVASKLGTSVNSLRRMSALKQLEYVEKFYNLNRALIPKIKSPEETYFLVFYPYAIGKSDDYVLGSQDSSDVVSLIATQNIIGDVNSDGKITKGEVKQLVRKKWGL